MKYWCKVLVGYLWVVLGGCQWGNTGVHLHASGIMLSTNTTSWPLPQTCGLNTHVDPDVCSGTLHLEPIVGQRWPGHPWGTGKVLIGGTGWVPVEYYWGTLACQLGNGRMPQMQEFKSLPLRIQSYERIF